MVLVQADAFELERLVIEVEARFGVEAFGAETAGGGDGI
jgi:hypothetical protein